MPNNSEQRASIILNGPDFIGQEKELDMITSADNVYAFSYAALTGLRITDFFYEPFTLMGMQLNERFDSNDYLGQCLHSICVALQLQIPIALESANIERIHLNPVFAQYPDLTIAYEYNRKKFMLDDYFYVNELSIETTLDSLKRYFSSGLFVTNPLNFRCSLIRATSNAYVSGCRAINIYGASPSTNKYWLGRTFIPELKLRNELWEEMASQWVSLEDLAMPQLNGGISNLLFEKSICYSFFLYIALLQSFHKKFFNDRLSINVFSNDPLIESTSISTNTRNVVRKF